jgi:uncharacterized membrane protein
MSDLSSLDVSAVIWLLLCWIAYTFYSERSASAGNLIGIMHQRRIDWMMRMLERENRMVDLQIVNSALNNATFFASTTILILAGLFAVMASPEDVITLVGELPFAAKASPIVWEIKVVLMMLIFAHGFFKFGWAMRQFNYCSLLIGAAPIEADSAGPLRNYAESAAKVASLAAKHFNHGVRSYYFGMAALSWFIHPGAVIPAALLVVLVLYRREFRSRTLRAIEACKGGT